MAAARAEGEPADDDDDDDDDDDAVPSAGRISEVSPKPLLAAAASALLFDSTRSRRSSGVSSAQKRASPTA